MFRRKEKATQPSGEPFTYIHQGTTLEGKLTAKGRVRVHGTVRGDVSVVGVLEVAEGGVIEGATIQATEVRIIGAVRANIEAKGKVEIWQKGRLEGDVHAGTLDIEEGAIFIGRSDMRPQATVAAPLPPEAKPGSAERVVAQLDE